MSARTRLTTEERREQLLRIGAELFACQPYDDVWIEGVAELAGVSRGLLYHYFPTKRDFFTAVVRAESARLLELTQTDADLPAEQRLTTGLDAYLDYIETHEHGYRMLHRATHAADENVRAIMENCLASQEQRIVDGLHTDGMPSEVLRVAVRGWLAFVIAACLDWLDHRSISRTALRDLCTQTLLGALAFVGHREDGR